MIMANLDRLNFKIKLCQKAHRRRCRLNRPNQAETTISHAAWPAHRPAIDSSISNWSSCAAGQVLYSANQAWIILHYGKCLQPQAFACAGANWLYDRLIYIRCLSVSPQDELRLYLSALHSDISILLLLLMLCFCSLAAELNCASIGCWFVDFMLFIFVVAIVSFACIDYFILFSFSSWQ